MQSYPFKITANKRPEVLERLLRVIRHRGFEVKTFSAEVIDNSVRITLLVHSTRDRSLLFNQLVKLPDVIDIE